MTIVEDAFALEDIKAMIARDSKAPFDLSQGEPLRATLYCLTGANDYVLSVVCHHIATDGFSFSIMLRELEALYRGEELPDLGIQYIDFARWQNKHIDFSVDLAFHVSKLKGAPQVLELPCDFVRPPAWMGNGAHLSLSVDSAIARGARRAAKEIGVSEFQLLFSCYGVLLSKYTRQKDLICATPIAGRDVVQNLIGFFVETIPIRVCILEGETFADYARRMKKEIIEALSHPNAPFDKIVKALSGGRDDSRPQVAQTMFTLEVDGDVGIDLEGTSCEQIETDQAGSKFEITLDISKEQGDDGKYCFNWEYATDLFAEETINRMHSCFITMLKGLGEGLHVATVESVNILSLEEKRYLIHDFNDNAIDYDECLKIHERFDKIAAQHPDNIACVFMKQTLTYAQAAKRSKRLASALQAIGVSGAVITLLTRDMNTPIAYLGALFAGGYYVPISDSYPEERIRFMIQDSEAKAIITQKSLLALIPDDVTCPRIIIDEFDFSVDADYVRAANDIAYQIYTSGSTGKPKGVLVPHAGVSRLVINCNWHLFDTTSTVVNHSPVSFDATTFELWGPLLNGGKVILFDGESTDIEKLEKTIVEHKATFMFFTARLFDVLVDRDSVAFHKNVIATACGGEALSASHVDKLLKNKPSLIHLNLYGPTECSSVATFNSYRGSCNSAAIGMPISNTSCYVVDENLRLVPRGVPGELLLGGPGVARGYLNRPEKTASVFVENPFAEGRAYRTGDLVRLNNDCTLDFLGRIDRQVKLHGYRIELSEVENALKSSHQSLNEAAVKVVGDKLVGYVTSTDTNLNTKMILEKLESLLPHYAYPRQ